MKVRNNVSKVNALVRITAGLTCLAWATARMVKKPHRESYQIVAMLGAMKVAEGIVRYCPVTALLEENGDTIKNFLNPGDSSGQEQQDQMIPYNPT